MDWSCSETFLNKKRSFVKIKTLKTDQLIEWEFTKFVDSYLSFYFYECRMKGLGETSIGYGTSRNQYNAIQKSFAEAWERLWFKKMTLTEDVEGEVITSSTGFAAGRNQDEAFAAAKGELIERAVMLAAWESQQGWKQRSTTSLRHLALITAYRLKGWRIILFDIVSNTGSVKACLALNKSYGSIFDTCFMFTNEQAETKVMQSVIKNIFFQKKIDNYILPQIGYPEDHRIFYADVRNAEAFNFMLDSRDSNKSFVLDSVDKVQIQLIHEADNFPAVAYARNTYWPEIKWGAQSIRGKNKWPHPLA